MATIVIAAYFTMNSDGELQSKVANIIRAIGWYISQMVSIIVEYSYSIFVELVAGFWHKIPFKIS